ncbi:MAG: CHASE3 domain-containing protein [Proteobacteria bacterium]|nr:CHASE3 domain-containing protein [Pseudomonadota bacterium]
MPTSVPPFPSRHWRALLLAVAVAVIIVLPFLLQRIAERREIEAASRVAHTLRVEGALSALLAAVRGMESAVILRGLEIDMPQATRERFDRNRAQVEPGLDEVERLTRDNPAQQVRLGAMRGLVRQRLALLQRIAAEPADVHAGLQRLVSELPLQVAVDEMIDAERAYLGERQADARRTHRQAVWAAWGSMIAQGLLLVWLARMALRAAMRRSVAERTSQRENARSAAVLDTVREPIVLVDEQLRVVMHNPAFGELFAVDRDARGQQLSALGNGAWANEDALRRLHDVLRRSRELWDYELHQHTADGIDRVMLVNARPMDLPDSDERVALITASDISAQKAGETHIRELNRQLQGKVEQVSDVNRELEAFSYSVSHDLRAPLRHISGFVGKLSRHLGDDLDDKGRHYLEVIGGSAKRMSALIDDLLVYSRLGRSAMRLQAVDIQSMVEETRAMLDADVAGEHPGHVVQWRIGPMPILVADENMLRQVWHNLMGNAVKYSARSEPARIEVEHRRNADGDHHFTVRDNGAGFDMQYAGKLFGVFQRLHAASEFSGTGIGLASVKRVVTRHNGSVWAEAAPGEGATFHFTLPANLDLKPASAP